MQVSGVHPIAPHRPGPAAPHTWPVGHEPQLIGLPQPSPCGPQLNPWITGIVIARSIDTSLAYKKDEACHFYSVRLRQDAEGKRGFGESYLGSEGASEDDIACAKVR